MNLRRPKPRPCRVSTGHSLLRCSRLPLLLSTWAAWRSSSRQSPSPTWPHHQDRTRHWGWPPNPWPSTLQQNRRPNLSQVCLNVFSCFLGCPQRNPQSASRALNFSYVDLVPEFQCLDYSIGASRSYDAFDPMAPPNELEPPFSLTIRRICHSGSLRSKHPLVPLLTLQHPIASHNPQVTIVSNA